MLNDMFTVDKCTVFKLFTFEKQLLIGFNSNSMHVLSFLYIIICIFAKCMIFPLMKFI